MEGFEGASLGGGKLQPRELITSTVALADTRATCAGGNEKVRNPGVEYVAVRVQDLARSVAELEAVGVRVLEPRLSPTQSARLLDPATTGGVPLLLVEGKFGRDLPTR